MDELIDSNKPEGRKRQRYPSREAVCGRTEGGHTERCGHGSHGCMTRSWRSRRVRSAAKEVAERKAAAILRHPRDESEAPIRQHVNTLKVLRGPAAPLFGVLMAVALAMRMTLPTLCECALRSVDDGCVSACGCAVPVKRRRLAAPEEDGDEGRCSRKLVSQ